MPKAYCPVGKHFPQDTLSFIPDCEIAILCDNEGFPTNRYADGIAGVTDEHRVAAWEEEFVHCPDHDNCECIWIHMEGYDADK